MAPRAPRKTTPAAAPPAGSEAAPPVEAPSAERLAQALAERDAALREVATLKAELEQLRLALRRPSEAPLPAYPATTAPGEPPLRYVVADQLNDGVKAALGPLHALGKKLAKNFGPDREG